MKTRNLNWRCGVSALMAAAVIAAQPALAQESPATGGTLVVANDTEPRNLNPAIVASNGVFFVASKIVEPLAEMDYETGLKPLLAESWSASDDGLSFTVNVRKGVTWSDGEPLTSADVAFSAMQVWKVKQNIGRQIFKNLTSVETPDEHTAIFKFLKPTPGQLIENALPAVTAVLPAHLLEGEDLGETAYNAAPVGTGPFVFAEHEPGQFYRLTRNENYWQDGKPYLDEIVYRVLPDPGAKAAALETGDLHLTAFSAVPLTDMERLDAIDGISVITKGYEGITYNVTLDINHRREELANPLVRKAIAHAIDQEFLIDVVFLGYATAATGPVPPTAADFYTETEATYPFDPAHAEELLDEAGYPRGADGNRFSLRLRPAPWFQQTRDTGSYVRQALAAVGIDVEIVTADPGGHIKAVYTEHDFDLAVGSPVWRNDPAISTTILYQGGLDAGVPFANQWGYDSAEMNALIAKGISTLDTAERTQVYRDFQELAQEDLPIIFLTHFTFLSVARDEVRNVSNNPRWATSGWADTWIKAD
ncbi:ABC transporter substrate-binding protein [Oricola sp.]|uniref:ABC transporter substrate-binding protein n=1 Tax=Oricola sp. TaxID=1979950 RepID=UPI003BACB919